MNGRRLLIICHYLLLSVCIPAASHSVSPSFPLLGNWLNHNTITSSAFGPRGPARLRGGAQRRRAGRRAGGGGDSAQPGPRSPPGSPCRARAAAGLLMRPLPSGSRKDCGKPLGLLALCLTAACCLQSKRGAAGGCGASAAGRLGALRGGGVTPAGGAAVGSRVARLLGRRPEPTLGAPAGRECAAHGGAGRGLWGAYRGGRAPAKWRLSCPSTLGHLGVPFPALPRRALSEPEAGGEVTGSWPGGRRLCNLFYFFFPGMTRMQLRFCDPKATRDPPPTLGTPRPPRASQSPGHSVGLPHTQTNPQQTLLKYRGSGKLDLGVGAGGALCTEWRALGWVGPRMFLVRGV